MACIVMLCYEEKKIQLGIRKWYENTFLILFMYVNNYRVRFLKLYCCFFPTV